MPNLAYHIEVLDQVIQQRVGLGDPVAININNSSQLKKFAVLGAMGPDMLRYTPVSPALATFLSNFIPPATSGTVLTPAQIAMQTTAIQTAMSNLFTANQSLAFELYFNPLGAIYSVLFSSLVEPVWPILDKITDFFNKLEIIVQNKDEIGLAEIIGQLSDFQNMSNSLKGLPSMLPLLQVVIGAIITQGPWMEMNESFPQPATIIVDRRHEFLRWHKTGEFAQNLLSHANTDNQKAYAFGWMCHVSTSVTSEPFINNITGGPYRTHWWRNRLVGNYVDSWTFGFFEQTPNPIMTGDNPLPEYFDPLTGNSWPALCNGGNLQDKFNVGNLADAAPDDVPTALKSMASGNLGALPGSFPTEIQDLFTTALNATYPAAELPIVGLDSTNAPIPAFNNRTLANAYVGAFSVYWFMTSGRGAVGTNIVGPGTGQPEPSWISSGGTPSPSQAGVNIGAAICAALLAIFGILSILGGDFAGGAAALAAALNEPIIDWNKVNNELFWLRKTLIDQENMLQNALVMGGLAYPPPMMLGAVVNVMGTDETLPGTDLTAPFNSDISPVPNVTGIPLCKSNSLSSGENATVDQKGYPSYLDATSSIAPAADLNFGVYPLHIQTETPSTHNPIAANLYPNTFVNGLGLLNGGMLNPTPYPSSYELFGDAVSNANQVLNANGAALPEFNLDGDRGYGWKDWNPQTGSNPFTLPVLDVEEV
ncbi:MAG: hypothetical protein JO080_06150 [Mucilaginibacter sp.]|nr:hypothetical protein [Mucilaginibacter sp.]